MLCCLVLLNGCGLMVEFVGCAWFVILCLLWWSCVVCRVMGVFLVRCVSCVVCCCLIVVCCCCFFVVRCALRVVCRVSVIVVRSLLFGVCCVLLLTFGVRCLLSAVWCLVLLRVLSVVFVRCLLTLGRCWLLRASCVVLFVVVSGFLFLVCRWLFCSLFVVKVCL